MPAAAQPASQIPQHRTGRNFAAGADGGIVKTGDHDGVGLLGFGCLNLAHQRGGGHDLVEMPLDAGRGAMCGAPDDLHIRPDRQPRRGNDLVGHRLRGVGVDDDQLHALLSLIRNIDNIHC